MLLIDETQADLAIMVAADLEAPPALAQGRLDLMDWLHYRARRVVSHPRQVVRSNEVEAYRAAHPAIDEIASRLVLGLDVSPWLSNKIRTAGSDPMADLMFNQWRISHFHLGPWLDNPRRVKRTGPVLFTYIDEVRAILVDVQPHGSWTRTDLLRILLRIDPTTMQDVGPTGVRPLTDDDHKTLRGKHANGTVDIDGRAYNPPGWGLVGSGASIRFRVMADFIDHLIKRTVREVETDTLSPVVRQRFAGQIGVPVRLGVRFERGAFVIYDKARDLVLAQTKMMVA